MDFTVENAGTTIACREYAGPDVSSDTPALVCVHGACVDGVFFDGIARELACDYRVIAYDRRGCGESGERNQPVSGWLVPVQSLGVECRFG